MHDTKKEAIKISKKSIFALLILATLSISACKSQSANPPASLKCGIQNCHGLDISCGQNVPEACTSDYPLGDFCRKFASCRLMNERCQLEQNDKFEQCKSCVDACRGLAFQKIFECESNCRQEFE